MLSLTFPTGSISCLPGLWRICSNVRDFIQWVLASCWQGLLLDEADSQRPTLFAKGVEETSGHRCQIPHRIDPQMNILNQKIPELITLVIITSSRKQLWSLANQFSNQHYGIYNRGVVQYSQEECSAGGTS